MDLILQSEVFTLPVVSFITGLVFCLLGRRILAFIVILFGFFIGYSWGTAFLLNILNVSLMQYPWLPWAAGAVGAALGLIAWKVSSSLPGLS